MKYIQFSSSVIITMQHENCCSLIDWSKNGCHEKCVCTTS